MNVIERQSAWPYDGSATTSTINLHIGEWSYIILVERVAPDGVNRIEEYLDATPNPIEAFRTACKEVNYRPLLKQMRRGLAYGFIIDGPKFTATIIPTPRYQTR